jgi:hypothetical protein
MANFVQGLWISLKDDTIAASNRQIWYRHPNKQNTKVRPEMTKLLLEL